MTLRRTPEDFIVDERLTPAATSAWTNQPTAATSIAVYALRKNSLTTPEGVHWLAKSLGVRDGLISHAGLKDKHAVTTQHVTVRLPDAKQRAALPEHVHGDNGHGWSARRVGWTDTELAAEAIDSNRFVIVVRDLTREDVGEMNSRARALQADGPSELAVDHGRDSTESEENKTDRSRDSAHLRIVNYFGDQRFGSARHDEGWIAAHLVRGDFEHALRLAIGTPARKDTGVKRTFTRMLASKWGGGDRPPIPADQVDWKALALELPRCPERRAIEALAAEKSFRDAFAQIPAFTQQMCVEAFQSHLWNEIVRRFVRSLASAPRPDSTSPSDDLLVTPDPFGELVFPRASLVPPDRLHAELSMPSPTAKYDAPWRDLALAVLRDADLSLSSLTIPGLRRPTFGDASRPVLVTASEFDMTRAEPDEMSKGGKRLKRTVSFTLPRGAYATVLLRALGC